MHVALPQLVDGNGDDGDGDDGDGDDGMFLGTYVAGRLL